MPQTFAPAVEEKQTTGGEEEPRIQSGEIKVPR
jgi:hypothetical protein